MSEREELAALLPYLSDEKVHALLSEARLTVTMAPDGEEVDAPRRAWEQTGAADMLTSLEALEADLPPGEVASWLNEMWENATPYRFNPATGELDEVKA